MIESIDVKAILPVLLSTRRRAAGRFGGNIECSGCWVSVFDTIGFEAIFLVLLSPRASS